MRKKLILSAIILVIMLILLTNSQTALSGARKGLLLWYHTLFPTLMPFMVLSNLIVLTGAAKLIGKLLFPVTRFLKLPSSAGYCILVGLLCGYPMGAYVCTSLNSTGELSDSDTDYLTVVCNNVSPMFMISFIAINCLGDEKAVMPVLVSILGGTFISMILFRLPAILHKSNRISSLESDTITANSSIASKDCPDTKTHSVINISINNTINASIKLCIYVMLFSITGALIGKLSFLPDTIKAGMMSLCEITAGMETIASLSISYSDKFLMMIAFSAFGGLSSIFQTMSLADGSHFNTGKYLIGKILMGIISCIVATVIIR